MFLIPSGQFQRPSRLTPEAQKDQDYHARFARWAVGMANNVQTRDRITNTQVNRTFYSGDQWIMPDDTEGFLMDSNRDARNRIKFVQNIIKPLVEGFRGTSVRLGYNSSVINTSQKSANRRDTSLQKLLFMADLASRQTGPLKEVLEDKLGLPQSQDQLIENHGRTFSDDYCSIVNDMLVFMKQGILLDDMKLQLTMDIALGGLGVVNIYKSNRYVDAVHQDINYFFYDTSCKKPDLQDSQYQGNLEYHGTETIFELFSTLSSEVKKKIEKFASNSLAGGIKTSGSPANGRIPLYNVLWRDSQRMEYGWVKDEYGYEFFTRINFAGNKYTDSDLIIPSNEKAAAELDTSKKVVRWPDILRYCKFIPGEVIGPEKPGEHDLVLEFGQHEYSERDPLHPDSCQYPFKSFVWAFQDGRVIAPVDDAIDPQRFINRIISVFENHVNNAKMPFTAYDKDAMADVQNGEEELMSSMNTGKPFGFSGKRVGIGNLLMQTRSGLDQGVMSLFNMIGSLVGGVQQSTGNNDPMQGVQGGSEAVGITQMLIQRGTLMQEPFYFCLFRIFDQLFQGLITFGKKVYAEDERKLSIIVGDKNVKVIQVTKNIAMEEFKSFMERRAPDTVIRKQVDDSALALLGAGLLSKARFVDVYGKGDMNDLTIAIRQTVVELMAAESSKEREQQRMLPVMQQALAEQQNRAQAGADKAELTAKIQDLEDKEHDLTTTMARETMRNTRAQDTQEAVTAREAMKLAAK